MFSDQILYHLRDLIEKRDRELALLEELRAAIDSQYIRVQQDVDRLSRAVQRLNEAKSQYPQPTGSIEEPDFFFEGYNE